LRKIISEDEQDLDFYRFDGRSKLEDLSDREIISNMAFIFVETNFWDDKPKNTDITKNIKWLNSMDEEQINKVKYEKRLELYFGRIKKKLQKNKKLEEEYQFENITNKFFKNR
jgi:hypothetical protein